MLSKQALAAKLLTKIWVAALQFLVIWRFFRFWALTDGMQVPENMLRCICNNYDVEVITASTGKLMPACTSAFNWQCLTLRKHASCHALQQKAYYCGSRLWLSILH